MEPNEGAHAPQPADNHAANESGCGGIKILQRKKPPSVVEEKPNEASGQVLDNWEDFGDDPQLEALQKARQDQLVQAAKALQKARQDQLVQAAKALKIAKEQSEQKIITTSEDSSRLHRSESLPVVRIMKRPDTQTDCQTTDDSKDESKLTLQQRERAYAEARMRIFGVAEASPSPIEEGDEDLTPQEILLKKDMTGLNVQQQFMQQLNQAASSNVSSKKRNRSKKNKCLKSPYDCMDDTVPPVQVLPTTRLTTPVRPACAGARPQMEYGRPPAHLMHRVQSCPDTTRPPPLSLPPSVPPSPWITPSFPPAPRPPVPNYPHIQGQYFPPQFKTWK